MYNFIKSQRIKFALKKNKRRRAFRNLATMERVLILFHYRDWMQIQLVANDLERNGKKVVLWTVETVDATTVNIRIPLVMRVLTEEDMSKTRCIRQNTELEFRSMKYDTLIDFCRGGEEEEDHILSYLLSINKAEFCIGNRVVDNKQFDFIITQGEGKGVLETFGQMKVYLQNIIP